MKLAPKYLRWLRPSRSVLVFAFVSGFILVSLFGHALITHLRSCVSADQVAQLQPGMTRQEVISLLGQPRFRTFDEREWCYDAPLEPLDVFYLSSADYRLSFSADGRFASVFIDD